MKTIINAIIANLATLENTKFDIDNIVNEVMNNYNLDNTTAKLYTGLALYHTISATNQYCIVAENTKEVFCNFYTFSQLLEFDCFNVTISSNNEFAIRLKVSNELKKSIFKNGFKVANIEEKNHYKTLFNFNNGQISEYLVKDHFSVCYQRDNLPFFMYGDMELNNTTIQIKSHKATFATIQQIQRYINKYTLRKFYTYNLTTEIITDEIDVDMVIDKIFDMPYAVDTKSSRWFICADEEIQNTLIELYKSFYYDENSSAFWSLSQIATNNGLKQYELLNYLMCLDKD
ncbi:MAG: hypothetical protein IKU15_08940 [Clostridia bacterium]|nr:hypothetical protein [Clostridia bacterium]